MAYEIPQQLQHKEKILFGLTFVQLGWAVLFLIPALLFLLSKTADWIRFGFGGIFVVLGILFVFFDIGKWIKRIFHFLQFKTIIINTKKMDELIQVKKIEKNIIYAKNEVAILEITPLNFNIKTDQDKETIMISFQKFLNSIDFPIQFVITTHNLYMDEYLKKLGNRTKNKKIFEDFSKFLNSLISKNQIRNRKFFIIISKTSNLEIQAGVCKERLESIGLKTRRIKDVEILNNLHLFFNDETDKRDSKEEESISGLHYLIAPNLIEDKSDWLKINKKFCRIIMAGGYPRIVQSGFLDKIISSNDDFDISIHIEPFSIESMMIMLNRELQKQRADLYSEELKRSLNPSLEIKYNDTRKVLEEMQKGNEKLFNVSLYINCKGKTKEELDFLTKKVESELNSIMIVPQTPFIRQISAYKSMVPIANDELKETRNITTKALSAFFPFTSPFLNLDENGVMLGLNKNKVPFIKDIYSLSNANGVVLATSGSGKSYFTKLLISRQMLNDTKIMIIDPQGEYRGLTEQVNGQLINISRNSNTIINPLDLMGHDYLEKRLALMDLFKIMFGELSEIQKSIIDKAVTETYAKKGITADSYLYKEPPILKDLYDVLLQMDNDSSQAEKQTYRALTNRLYMYVEGVFSFMNVQTNLNFKKDFVCFNIGDMPKQVKPIMMFLILDYIYMKMKKGGDKKLLVIDEAWSLLSQTEEAGYIFEIVKTCRKYNLGLLLITQDVADLINSKAGHAVLANSSYTFLLRQKASIISYVVKTFNLSQMEKEYLLSATQGKGILILDNEHQELEVIASPEEHKIITTNPNEIKIKIEKNEDERKSINIKLDTKKIIHYGNKLNIEEENYLTNAGYEIGHFVPIGKVRQEKVWVKTNKVESSIHTFLVHNIKEELEKLKAKDIQVSVTKEADITFKDKKGNLIAIEVETGISFDKRKNKIKQKFNEAKLKYKNLYLVLTNANDKYKYASVTEDIPILVRTDLLKLFRGF